MNGKSLTQSKTFWFNVVVAVLLFMSTYAYPESWAPVANVVKDVTAFAAALGNVILRLVTSEPIRKVK